MRSRARWIKLDAKTWWPKSSELAAPRAGRLTGRVDVEDVLDVIFRDFCVGK